MKEDLFPMDWPIFQLVDGRLVENGKVVLGWPAFESEAEAEKFLVDNDERGSIRQYIKVMEVDIRIAYADNCACPFHVNLQYFIYTRVLWFAT